MAFQLLEHLAKPLGPRFGPFLESIQPAHSDLLSILQRHAVERQREDKIISLRRVVSARDLRFFLALLLNVPDRKRLLTIVADAFPGPEPAETVAGWVNSLSKAEAILEWGTAIAQAQPTVGIRGERLDDLSLRILPHMLRGATDRQIASKLKGEDVRLRCRKLRLSEILKPLVGAPD